MGLSLRAAAPFLMDLHLLVNRNLDGFVLEPGLRAPDFVLPDRRGVPTRFYARVGGRPVLLLFGQTDLECDGCDRVVVVDSTQSVDDEGVHFRDTDGAVARQYGVEEGGAAILLDANLRVIRSFDLTEGEVEEAIRQALSEEGDSPSLEVLRVAPVLTVPRVLELSHCDYLMTLWEEGGHVETGVESSEEGERSDVLSELHKRREDHTVVDPKLIRLLTTTVGRRLLPELDRAFGAKPTRFEGFKIACYDAASAGFFDAHRDNLSPSTSHRQFAVSLNLNDDYVGGHLVFPEYGDHRYRPEAGGALVFSCAHLHAVAPVTEGRRFTLLTFLYDRERSDRTETTIDPFQSAVARSQPSPPASPEA